jgi:aminopeptidase N
VIFSVNVSEGGRKEYDAVKEEYIRTDSVDGKEICLSALGRTKDAALVKDYLDFVFSDKVAIQDIHSGAVSLAANSKVRHLLWQYIKDNWTAVETRLSFNNVVFERFVRMGLSKFADHQISDEIATFFKDKETGAYDRALVIVSDNIRTNASYKEREEALVLEWLQAHGYA